MTQITAGESISPIVSFVVPALNEEGYIADCIQALRSQRVPGPAEIIVVDNGSRDATAAVARQNGARVVVQPIRGLAAARQAGLTHATGAVIIYVDSDSRLAAGWAERVYEWFQSNPRLVGVSTAFEFYDGRFVDRLGNGVFQRVLCPLVNHGLRLLKHPEIVIGSAFAVRADALRQAGGIDQRFQFYGEDTMIALRLGTEGQVRYFDTPRYETSARRYQKLGILPVVARYFAMFALLHLGQLEAAQYLARAFAEERQGRKTAGEAATALSRDPIGMHAEIGGGLALAADGAAGTVYPVDQAPELVY
jgi:glycosyltransferase involved in cell wall biosynthesis